MKLPKKKKSESLSKLKAKVWKLFSEFIRRRNADWRGYISCVTCHKKSHWKGLQAGHFVGGRHSNLLFDLRNCHSQCYRCNCILHGNLIPYYEFMLKTYGQEVIDDLKAKDKVCKQFTRKELELLELAFKEKISKLK